MAPRVIIGRRGTDTGMWVSAPGKSAMSTAPEDLLIDTTRENAQPVLRGSITDMVLNKVAGGLKPENRLLYNYNTQQFQFYSVLAVDQHAVYEYYINHNLGYVPLTQISVGAVNAGEPYPAAVLTNNQIIFRYIENWDVKTDWDGNGYTSTAETSKPSTYTAKCFINYTVYRQRAI